MGTNVTAETPAAVQMNVLLLTCPTASVVPLYSQCHAASRHACGVAGLQPTACQLLVKATKVGRSLMNRGAAAQVLSGRNNVYPLLNTLLTNES